MGQKRAGAGGGAGEGGGRANCRSTKTQGLSVLSSAWRCDRHANLANTLPLPSQAPSPATAPRATKPEPGQEVWGWVCVQTQHRPPPPGSKALAISLCPTLGPWGGVGTGDQYAWLGDRERRKPWTETVSKEQGPVLQQPLGTSNIPPEGQGDRRQEEQESDPGGHLESDRVGGGG